MCVGKTLQAAGFQVLPYQAHVPSFGQWGWHLAWLDDRRPDEVLADIDTAAGPLAVPTKHLTPSVLTAAFVWGRDAFKGRDDIQTNSKMQPIILHYYHKSWR